MSSDRFRNLARSRRAVSRFRYLVSVRTRRYCRITALLMFRRANDSLYKIFHPARSGLRGFSPKRVAPYTDPKTFRVPKLTARVTCGRDVAFFDYDHFRARCRTLTSYCDHSSIEHPRSVGQIKRLSVANPIRANWLRFAGLVFVLSSCAALNRGTQRERASCTTIGAPILRE